MSANDGELRPKREITLPRNPDERYWVEQTQLVPEQERLQRAWEAARADLRRAQDALSQALTAGEPIEGPAATVKVAKKACDAAKADYDDHAEAWMRARGGAR